MKYVIIEEKLNWFLFFLFCVGLVNEEYFVDLGIIIIIVMWNIFIVSDFEDGFLMYVYVWF